VNLPFPEPSDPVPTRAEVLLRYLDYFRSRLISKIESLPADELRRSRLPSGWTPLELLNHVAHDELRWLEWRFAGRDVTEPWADERDGRLYVPPDRSLAELLAALREQADRSRAVVAAHDLADLGRPGAGWPTGQPATLERVLLHLLQEYARHVGHLDIVAELAGGEMGE
jgi:uncharacterized damage-inducible protein DinB